MLANVINVTHKLKEKDKEERKMRGDKKDCLGLVQDSGFHDGFEAVMFTKECLMVRCACFF